VYPHVLLQEICYRYWPSNTGDKGTQEFGEFSVSTLEAVIQDGFVQRLFGVTNSKARIKQQHLSLELLGSS